MVRKIIGEETAAGIAIQPKFTDPADERRYRKQRLAAGFRLFAYYGFTEGIAGHISVRDPEQADQFWVNPIGLHFSKIKTSDLILINHAGEVIEGSRAVNGAAFTIHSGIHQARQDIIAAAHAHSLYGKTWASFGQPIAPITQDACAFYENLAVFSEFTGVVIEADVGKRMAATLGDNIAMILQNHGLLTVGQTVDAAIYTYLLLERCCQSQLLAEAAGKPKQISHEVAIKTRDYIASSHALWQSFQPLYNFIVKAQPDLLE